MLLRVGGQLPFAGQAPLLLVAADLLESDDPRGVDTAHEAIARIVSR